MKKALITGITGQDGSYLAEFLIKKGYTVYGIIRRSSSFNTQRIDHLYQDPHEKDRKLNLVYGDLNDASSLNLLIKNIRPDEIYNLGAQSHVKVSFEVPEYTAEVTGLGTTRLLEAIRDTGIKTKFYQASSSEMYGKVLHTPQNEETPFYPRSPYGAAKAYAYWMTVNYREAYNMFACNGILFNHESPRRGETFVTRKITMALAKIKLGLQDKLYLGNLDAKRDWGFAKDYVEGMWRILQQDEPEDFVLATGVTTTVRKFVEMSFSEVGVEVTFQGTGIDERGVVKSCSNPDFQIATGTEVVKVDKNYFRPTEVELLIGNPAKAKAKLGWEPSHTLHELVKEMVAADLDTFKKEKHLRDSGFFITQSIEH